MTALCIRLSIVPMTSDKPLPNVLLSLSLMFTPNVLRHLSLQKLETIEDGLLVIMLLGYNASIILIKCDTSSVFNEAVLTGCIR